MYEILEKRRLNAQTVFMTVYAPFVAKKALAGQFIIFRATADGERIPLTIADYNREKGTISIIFQEIGYSTKLLGTLNVGDYINDFVGPLGNPSETKNISKIAIIGGGLGCAIAYPQAKAFFNAGAEVDIIAGFRSKDMLILENEMKKVSNNLYICTDDGSYGTKGLVTGVLEQLINDGNKYDTVIAIGPLIMMKFVCLLTKKYDIKTIVSMNTIMIDGTGMCGGCRLTVDGKMKFACVDGPDFDGHKIDFDEVIRRSNLYKPFEKDMLEKHECNLLKGEIENA